MNLTDEGLKKLANEVGVLIECYDGFDGGRANHEETRKVILSYLQQVRDAAKKEERERCAKVADGDIPNHFEWESELNDILHSAAHGKFASNQDLGNALMKWKCKNSITSTAIRQGEGGK